MGLRVASLLTALALAVTGCALATKAPPVADAGPDLTVWIGEKVTYDASSSVDLDGGQIVFYQWKITATPEGREQRIGEVLREGTDAATWTTPEPMGEDDLGTWVVEVLVTDDEDTSATDDLVLTVIR